MLLHPGGTCTGEVSDGQAAWLPSVPLRTLLHPRRCSKRTAVPTPLLPAEARCPQVFIEQHLNITWSTSHMWKFFTTDLDGCGPTHPCVTLGASARKKLTVLQCCRHPRGSCLLARCSWSLSPQQPSSGSFLLSSHLLPYLGLWSGVWGCVYPLAAEHTSPDRLIPNIALGSKLGSSFPHTCLLCGHLGRGRCR